MSKKPAIFKRFKFNYRDNIFIIIAIIWVTFMPSLGAFLTVHKLYSQKLPLEIFSLSDIPSILSYVVTASLCMGMAFLPTTLLSILSGFLLGWNSFPFLVLAYVMASIFGYLVGRKLDQNSLEVIMKHYPRVSKVIKGKEHQMSSLIFFVRLSPVIPFALSNILFALLKTGLKKVVWAGMLGMLPRTLLAFFSGTMADSIYKAVQEKDEGWQLPIILLLILISIWGIYRFFKKNKSINLL